MSSKHYSACSNQVTLLSHYFHLNIYYTQTTSAYVTGIMAERPNVAGVMLLGIAFCRYRYAVGYASNDIGNRFIPFLVGTFATSVGVGYAALMGLSLVHVGPFVTGK
jgi:hypothetical protein